MAKVLVVGYAASLVLVTPFVLMLGASFLTWILMTWLASGPLGLLLVAMSYNRQTPCLQTASAKSPWGRVAKRSLMDAHS